MAELRLKYTDEYGETRRAAASGEIFTVGRHPENDLCVPDNRLSRVHLRIEHYNGSFYASDAGSSNGTTLNGAPLRQAAALHDGDRLNLGGAVDLRIEFAADAANGAANASPENNQHPASAGIAAAGMSAPAVKQPKISASANDSGSIPSVFFWLAPIFGVVILIFVGGFFLLFGGKKEVAQNDGFDAPTTPRVSRTRTAEADETPTNQRRADSPGNATAGNAASTPDSGDVSPTAPKTSAESERVEQNAAAFLRRIAQNDPKAFLTGKQAQIVAAKINALKGSSALAENLKAVKKNQAQFETLASSKNLKGQFLATAALARIGNAPGDPLAVANQMLPVLTELKITLDNKLADDNLMIVAAFERGAAGKPRSLQSTLEALSKTTQNVSPREIRSIWFLREKDKITEAEFNFAVQFLAVGTISQNPKDFNVNADAVTFD